MLDSTTCTTPDCTLAAASYVVFQDAIEFDAHLFERLATDDDARHASSRNPRVRVTAKQIEGRTLQSQ